MAGTTTNPIFVKDGQYLSFVTESAVTLGQLVELTSSGTVQTATVADGTNVIIGVAVSARRASRTQTDDSVAAGEYVTVCTRGVVNVLADTTAILVGSLLEASATGGSVALAGTAGTAGNIADSIGMALEANGGAAITIKALLMRG